MTTIKVGIMGGAGYTAGELLRILINHPQVKISFVHSNSHEGHKIYEAHSDLLGDTDITFTDNISTDVDVLFLCLGHSKAIEFLYQHAIPEHIRIIDLSQDFRLNNKHN